MSRKNINKGVNTYQKKRKVIESPTPDINILSQLNNAVKERRVPTPIELLDECKSLLGVVLIGLRAGQDAYKAATAVANIVKAISQITQLERIEEVSAEALKSMSNEELKAYASKLIDKMAA